MADQIILTREEVREARAKVLKSPADGCPHFLNREPIVPYQTCILAEDAYCRLCKKLTEFAKGEEDE